MKYIFTAALALGLFATASAQQGPHVTVVRSVRSMNINNDSNMQIILDKLQQETENTIVYPLIRMTNMAFAKAQTIKKQHKHSRIRTNNTKRVVNPNRA